ncbi:MAG: asparaginase [Eubacteriales bacterium]|nr:asparaginase [Eubacteriales bacterium]
MSTVYCGSYVPLVIEYRGSLAENVHVGYVCVVDENSRVIGSAGDSEQYVYYRSSAKPIQALDTIAMGLHKKYNITDEESVLFAASHAGESFHADALTSVLGKTGFTEDMLVMLPAVPANNEADRERIRAGLSPRKIYHNCAGMHISLMLIERESGGDVSGYWKPGSLSNKAGIKTVAALSELTEEAVVTGVDGCGVPVFGVPMRNVAAAFKNLACVDTINDERLAGAASRYIPLINKHSHMIRGTGFLCTLLNKDPNIIAKGGGAGIYAIGLKKERMGISLKLADGTTGTWPLIIAEIFRQIGYNNPDTMKTLTELHDGIIYNDNKSPIGHCETVFRLNA